jgi:predicted Zn-dependent protease
MQIGLSGRRASLGFALVATMAFSTPVAQADIFKPGKGDQVKLGLRAAADLRKNENVLPDTDPRVITLRRIAKRLMSTFDDSKEPWQYTFDVIESKEVNAFALPGGPVFFYTGLLEKMTTEDEIAGVMGHELTHVRKEHWAYSYRDSMKANGILTIASIFGAPSGLLQAGAITNEMLLETGFSRKHEKEADEGGFNMMTAAGFNPEGMARTFETLKSLSGDKPPEFLSTHPDDGKRVAFIRELAKKSKKTYPDETPLDLRKGKGDSH